MISIHALLVRRADLTREQFREHYDVQHRRLFLGVTPPEVMAGIERYVQHHAARRSSPTDESPWDCITEMTFKDHEAMRRWGIWYESDEGRALREDELRFMDSSRRLIVITEPR